MYKNLIRVLNIDIDNVRMSDFMDVNFDKKFIIPVNVDVLMKLQINKSFYTALNKHRDETCVCQDSQIMKVAASVVLGNTFIEKISGSDLLPTMCAYFSDKNEKVFLLGAMPGIADKAMKNINARVGSNVVIDCLSPSFGFESNEDECAAIVDRINKSGATILAVGVGAPKQEIWIYKYHELLPDIKRFVAVGATIDFEAGVVDRSPKWVSRMGLEWLYRMFLEPKRLIKRYLVDDTPFFWLILKQRFGLYKDPFGNLHEK